MLYQIRSFFKNHDFFEVVTPSLVISNSFEKNILPLYVKNSPYLLHSSPEMNMKRVLINDPITPIYQISHVYRDDASSAIHFKEFMMLEFYWPYKKLIHLQIFLEEFFQSLSKKKLTFERTNIQALLLTHNIPYTGKETLSQLQQLSKNHIDISKNDSCMDIFSRLIIEIIEPNLNPDTLYIIDGYPVYSLGLYEKKAHAPHLLERIECYYKNIEIANGGEELTSKKEIIDYIQDQTLGQPHAPELFIEDLTNNMEPVVGCAIGIDRLFLTLNTDIKN